MNILLPPEFEEFVNRKIKSGQFHSPSEIVHAGLRLMKEQDELKRIRLEELRGEIMRGKEQIERGEYKTYESGAEVIEEIMQHTRGEGTERTGDSKTEKQPERKRA